jgi:mono/diheme cytochrome c family protein
MLIPMRRWLAILLLVFLPLQSLWAAAAPYCAHEETPKSMHLGHHAHEHQETQPEPDSSDGLGAAHTDCHVCHGAGGALPGPSLATVQVGHFGPLTAWDTALPAPPVSLPERPNWARLA